MHSFAASAFVVGHTKCDYVLRNKSIQLYGQALGLLSQELQPSQLAKHQNLFINLIVAGYPLSTYEVSPVRLRRWIRLLSDHSHNLSADMDSTAMCRVDLYTSHHPR
jgi:hypothetical protein